MSDKKLIEESPLSEAAVLWAVLGNKGGGGGGGRWVLAALSELELHGAHGDRNLCE